MLSPLHTKDYEQLENVRLGKSMSVNLSKPNKQDEAQSVSANIIW